MSDGSTESKEIYEIEEKEIGNYRLLGEAVGINMDHCVALGLRHKEGFWQRVYGYRIIKNEAKTKMFFEAMEKINPEAEQYVTACFYERFSDDKLMYVPKRLEIPGRPELNNFPLNLLFSTITIGDEDTKFIETCEYAPDTTSFKETGELHKMTYYNVLDNSHKFWVEIIYNARNCYYTGSKYCRGKLIGTADGNNWRNFFMHLSLLGVGSDLDISN